MITLEPGARIDTYRLIRPLGRGGFAEVWEAQNETDGRRVALKVLTELRADSARALERFEQEGQLAASLSSPQCVYVFGAGAWDGCPYIVMELMAGGTLAGRLEAGPLECRTAVDCVLDVLDGLEAAQQAGILHRDVKPSNVFLGADGRAKIGDFGISKSLEADSKLSQTGVFLGTPYYASPEQIAAEPLDLRSDLYSVGAMLYELVTGRLPYQGTNPSQVLAQVLTREPVPFAQHPASASVPLGLQRVVMRLLAKQREKRYQTYEETRAALARFSSRGLTAPPQARRFGAIVIDLALFFPVGLILGALLVQNNFRGQLATSLSLHLSQLVYFCLTEAYGGASVGKRLLGLRVTTADGASPGLHVVFRTLVFLALYAGPGMIFQQLAMHGVSLGAGPLGTLIPAFAGLLGLALIVVPMRARNGYAGAHELLSGTRVMALVTREGSTPVASSAPGAEPTPGTVGTFGPYRATGTIWSTGGQSLVLARDEALRRDVWIHTMEVATGLPSLEVLRERGGGSLPWLQRGSSGAGAWDAYGAPVGTPLTAMGLGRGLDWRQMRVVLRSIVVELQSRLERHGTAGRLAPEYVWIDPQGRALLLDFPASGPTGDGVPATEVTPSTWRAFLRRVVAAGLRDPGTGQAGPSLPLPEHARTLLATLSDDGSGSISDFAEALERASGLPSRVTAPRRAAPLAILAIVPAMVVVMRLIVPVFMTRLPVWYQDLTMNAQAYVDSLRSADRRAAADTTARRTAEAIRIVLAWDRIEARLTPQIGDPALSNLPPHARADVDSAALRYPSPDTVTVARARAWLSGRVQMLRLGAGGLGAVPKAFTQGMIALGYLGVVGVCLAFALRGGLLFTLFGLALQRIDGTPAGRLRCGVRSLVAWGPVLLLALLSGLSGVHVTAAPAGIQVGATTGPPSAPSAPPSPAEDALVLLALGGAVFAVARPTRGLAERIAGVVLVPK